VVVGLVEACPCVVVPALVVVFVVAWAFVVVVGLVVACPCVVVPALVVVPTFVVVPALVVAETTVVPVPVVVPLGIHEPVDALLTFLTFPDLFLTSCLERPIAIWSWIADRCLREFISECEIGLFE